MEVLIFPDAQSLARKVLTVESQIKAFPTQSSGWQLVQRRWALSGIDKAS